MASTSIRRPLILTASLPAAQCHQLPLFHHLTLTLLTPYSPSKPQSHSSSSTAFSASMNRSPSQHTLLSPPRSSADHAMEGKVVRPYSAREHANDFSVGEPLYTNFWSAQWTEYCVRLASATGADQERCNHDVAVMPPVPWTRCTRACYLAACSPSIEGKLMESSIDGW